MRIFLKGVYTLEAAYIMSICFLFTGFAIKTAYTVFQESFEYVQGKEDDFNAVKTFRAKEALDDLL